MTEAALDQSARVTRIDFPISLPGHCAICGKNEHPKGFAATDNFDFEGFGTVYFCYDCIGDYARVFGYMSSEELTALLEKQKSMTAELSLLRESVVNLESILDAYSKLRPNSGLPDHRAIVDVVSSADANEGNSEGEGTQLQLGESDSGSDDSTTERPVESGEAEDVNSDEHANQSRSDDVSGSTSNVTALFADLGI